MFWSAFTIGLLGSMHCVGMCGPIAISLPYGNKRWQIAAGGLTYNVGRVVTYTLMGSIIGLLGKGAFMAGIQRWLALGLGILLLIIAVFSIPVETKLVSLGFTNRLYLKLKTTLGRSIQKHGVKALFLTGMLNGLLPCGLVYLAIMGAVSQDSILNGAGYMAMFGLGTIPLMLLTSLTGGMIAPKWRSRIQKFYPIFLVIFAALFIARGLNFDLPRGFNFWESSQEPPMCH